MVEIRRRAGGILPWNHKKYHRKSGSLSCLAAAAVCVPLLLTACGREDAVGGDSLSGTAGAAGAGSKQGWVYVPEIVTVEDEHADYGRMQLVGDTFCYVSQEGDAQDSAKTICRYSLTERDFQRLPLDFEEGGENWDVGERCFDGDYNVYLTANVYPADYGTMTRFLCKFDGEGNCVFSRDITEQLGRGSSLEGLTVDRQGRIYVFADGGEILLYTQDGEYRASVSCSSPESSASVQIRGACDGSDGKYYVCVSKGYMEVEGQNASCSLMEIDFDSIRLSEAAGNLPDIKGICGGVRREEDSAGQSGALIGAGGSSGSPYDFLLYDDRAVYGFDLDAAGSGTAGEQLFAWMDSDINGYCVTNLYLLEDGKLCATVEDWNNDDRAIVLLERTGADQAPEREELVLATVDGDSDLAAMAVKFNKGNSQYHLTVKSFESLTALYNAVLTKEPMDLIDLSGIHVEKLASQGFFENLAPYVDQSKAFGRSDFVDGILDVYTFDDTLVGIPATFTLRTVAGSGAQGERQAGLTLEELLAYRERYPDTRTFDGIARDEMMQYLMMFNEDTFIDWDIGFCHFDSETFRAVLEYLKEFPDSLKDQGSPESGGEEISLPGKIRDGEVLFAVAEFRELRAFQEYKGMFGEEACCIGFPTPNGRGGHLLLTEDAYAIASLSQHKEGAWKFIEGFLAREKSESCNGTFFYNSFPTLKKTLNERVEEAIEADSQYGSDKFPELIYEDGSTFQYHALTWDEVNVMLDLVPDAKPYFDAESDEILRIISEEAAGYYSGQRGIEDVTEVIQNRIQLYMNENR